MLRLNMEDQTLAELMDWEAEPLTEPLLTATSVQRRCRPSAKRRNAANHMQGIDRAVNKVSEDCLLLVGKEEREAWIRCAEVSRRTLPKPETKADYMSLLGPVDY